MNTGQRIAIILAALVVLAGGFFIARGSSDDPSPAEVTETSEGTGGAEAPATTPATTTPEAATQEEAPPPPRVETIRIRDGKPASGEARTLKFDSGETVRLRFSSNAASEVHIHGYDKYVDVPAGGAATARFKADAEGVFEIESHGSGELLAKLPVAP